MIFVIQWFFVILKCQVLYHKLLSRKFRNKNFRDHSEIHEITKIFVHGNLEPNPELYKAKILEYVNTCQQQQALPT